jgi:hypothetical protein
MVIVYATFLHSGISHLSQLIIPFDVVVRVFTIEFIALVKSRPPSAQSEHKQLILKTAELLGEKLTCLDKGSKTPV